VYPPVRVNEKVTDPLLPGATVTEDGEIAGVEIV
jgi:hypothetical protein